MKKILLPALLCLALRGAAQLPLIVTDLAPGAAGSAPFGLVVFKDWLCFAASTPGKGFELWRYDGSSAPAMVPEINAGSGDGLPLLSYTPPAELNGRLYFAATNAGGTGVELWQYDGINAPALAADINPGPSGSLPAGMTLFGNRIFFAASTAAAGAELYSCNGGQPLLYDLAPGTGSSSPSYFTVFNGKLYFSAGWPGSGRELCVYDSATNTAALAADVVPGPVGSEVRGMTVADGMLYFTATTGATGQELWRYDGTAASLVKDLTPGNGSGQAGAAWLASYGGKVYFSGTATGGGRQLYRYDPVTDSMELVAVVNPAGDMQFSWPYVFDNKLYFAADDGSNGVELWSYDGTAAALVSDINPGGGDSEPGWFCGFNGRLYFSAGSAATGRELYRLQGAGGVQNAAFTGSAAVAPNPAQGSAVLLLSLRQAQRCGFSLTDVSGRTVWQQPEVLFEAGEHRIQLPVADLPAGIYFYSVKERGKVLVSGKLEKR